MTSRVNNERASNDLFGYIGSVSDYVTMNNFQNRYKSLIHEYFSKPESRLLSEIDVSNLETYKSWTMTALQEKNKIYPLLISKILQGDIFALNIYDNLHQVDGKSQLILSYSKIHSDPLLMEKFNAYGSSEDARAILTAEYWLKSQEAVELMGQNSEGLENLCSLTGMLHLNNEYIIC